ncbi:MAG: aspartate-semialdehyde dehydrogenase [Spirochaetes bacterium]|nr:aspartate-semialdehyde dehydrogenase [Spirochaetota bacterium]MBN2769318.1 aspartate-semialdehyde dehydrogenase [Spirochaetota bacterium]
MKKYNVVILGATGAVGLEFRKLLVERKFPIDKIKFLGKSTVGQQVDFGDTKITVEAVEDGCFDGYDIALFSGGGAISLEVAKKAVEAGCVVIDNSSAWRMDPEVPLVVPEVNAHAVESHKGIIANPNCTTIQMVVCLQAIEKLSHIKKVHVSTYQAASGAGASGMAELEKQFKQIVNGEEPTVSKFAYQLAMNIIPQVDVFTDNGYTKEEMKMFHETKKIMESDIDVSATCVRIPVMRNHSEAIWLEAEKELDPDEVRKAFESAPGVKVIDDPASQKYPMPLWGEGEDDVFVGRIRKDLTNPKGLTFWCVGDQIKKGAALNAVQIAELLIDKGLV